MSTVRLSEEIKVQVRRVADAKGWTVSKVHRQALEDYCGRELSLIRPSPWDDIIGMAEGVDLPPDASSRVSELFGRIVDEKHGRHAR